jgi:glycosyltransferase involved in cell wall biosynthesis
MVSAEAPGVPRSDEGSVCTAAAPPALRILYLIDYFHRTGGTETHLVQLMLGLPPERFICSMVAFDLGANPLLDRLRARNIEVLHLPVGREYVPHAAVQAWRLSRLIRKNRYDVIQTYHQKADTYGALIAWLSGARHLVSSKRDTGDLRKPWHVLANRCLSRLFDAFIAVAEGVRAAVVARDHLAPAKVTTIYNGVDTERFQVPTAAQRAEARQKLGFGPDDFVVGMVAGFRPEKNHDVFFAGLLQALPSIPTLKVLAVGAGPLLHEVRDLISRGPLGPRVVFTGDVPDVVPYLQAMDIGCLTPGSNEGFSNAIIEQMAIGLPMIVTDVGGNAEAVVDGANGQVIPPADPQSFCRALLKLHDHPESTAAMGRSSRSRVQTKFSLANMCTRHAELYVSLCKQRSVATP